MPWQEASVMSLKYEFVRLAEREGTNVRELCRRFAILAAHRLQAAGRYAREGEAGLADRSRRPRHSPDQIPGELERAVLAVRDAHPVWGGRKLRAVLLQRGYPHVPSPSTITAILRRNDRLTPRERTQSQRATVRACPPQRPLADGLQGPLPHRSRPVSPPDGARRSLPLLHPPAGLRRRAHGDGEGH